MIDCCVLVQSLSTFEDTPHLLSILLSVQPFLNTLKLLRRYFSETMLPWNIQHAQELCGFSPCPPYKLCSKDPPEVYAVPLGILMEDLPIIMLEFLRNMKRKLMVEEVFFLFVPTSIKLDGLRQTTVVFRRNSCRNKFHENLFEDWIFCLLQSW